MSQVYTSINRPVIANTFLLGSFPKLALRPEIFCDAQQCFDPLFIYLSIYLFIYYLNQAWKKCVYANNKGADQTHSNMYALCSSLGSSFKSLQISD